MIGSLPTDSGVQSWRIQPRTASASAAARWVLSQVTPGRSRPKWP